MSTHPFSLPTPETLKAELVADIGALRDFVCPECDWVTCDWLRPSGCPECGASKLETITYD